MNSIFPDNQLDLFLALVQIDSPTGSEAACSQYVADFLRSACHLKPTIDTQRNVFCRVPGEGEPVMFCAHLDTVEPGRQIKPHIEAGYVVSDGTTILGADNKSSVASILSVVQDISNGKIRNTRPLELVFTTSEESGDLGAIGFNTSLLKAKLGYIFDVGLPVGTIITSSPYYLHFVCDVKGESAHAAHREHSKPALPIALNLMTQIENLRIENVIVNTGLVSGGSARNTIIGRMHLEGEIRSFNHDLFYTAKVQLEEILNAQTAIPIDSEVVVENAGYEHEPELVEKTRTQIEKILGHKVNTEASYGCSDANIFNEDDVIQVINLGDGGEGAHTIHERVALRDLDELKQLIAGIGTT